MKREVKDMDCAQFERLLHDLDRPGTEGFSLREAALGHAESCSVCAQLLTQAESLDLALRAVAERESGRQAPPRLEKLLRDEYRRGAAASARRRVRWQLAALATAAVLLLALGLSLRHRAESPSRNGGSRATPAAVATGNSPALASDSASEQGALADSQVADSDSSTAFVPLPYADTSAASEDGAIVRVELSRSELASFGLPVTDLSATDRIPADIIVGEDGAPQAIRLVSQSSLDD